MTQIIRIGIDGDRQRVSFQNATLQSNEGATVDFSIATHVKVPAELSLDRAVEPYLTALFDMLERKARSEGFDVSFEIGEAR